MAKLTSKELAQICGVSIGTVDRALHNRPGINPKTKEKILRTSRELGYRPHLIARSLKIGRTMTIGVVVFDLDNQYFSELISALEKRLRDEGYFLHLTLSDHERHREIDCLEHLVSLRVDGIFLVATNRGSKFSQFVKNLHVPVVALGNKISRGIPFVGIDDRAALRNAVDYVVGAGYRRIVYCSPPLAYLGKENVYAVAQRFEGYKDGIRKHHLQENVIRHKLALEPLTDLLRKSSKRTAVLCSSDIYALQTVRYLKSMSFRIPDDVGVMGFDDIHLLEYVSPPLTTVSQRVSELADSAVRVLLRQIENHDVVEPVTLIDAKIVPRESL